MGEKPAGKTERQTPNESHTKKSDKVVFNVHTKGALDIDSLTLKIPKKCKKLATFDRPYKFPLADCSRSIASKSALKFPFPKLFAPLRWMISKKIVGRSSTGLVKICNR